MIPLYKNKVAKPHYESFEEGGGDEGEEGRVYFRESIWIRVGARLRKLFIL